MSLLDYQINFSSLGEAFSQIFRDVTVIQFVSHVLMIDGFMAFFKLIDMWVEPQNYDIMVAVMLLDFYTNSNPTLVEFYTVKGNYELFGSYHYFFLQQLLYKICLQSYSLPSLTILKTITLNLPIVFISGSFLKWYFCLILAFIVYFYTNLENFIKEYQINFYITYFKLINDLAEHEFGCLDDFKVFLVYFTKIFVVYCWLFFFGCFFFKLNDKIIPLVIFNIIFVLSLPFKVLWYFGLAFNVFTRGSAKSSNFLLEFFFDTIALLVVFMRFIIQNIRFIFIFLCLLELFELTYTSFESDCIIAWRYKCVEDFKFTNENTLEHYLQYLINLIWVCIWYLFYFLHLIIVSFAQLLIYFIVSFWLFFFLYTSFIKYRCDNYFVFKR